MKLKVIGVNPFDPAQSKLIKESDIDESRAIVMTFKNPLRQLKIKTIRDEKGDLELVVFIGTIVEKEKYIKRAEELKRIVSQKRIGNAA